MKPLNLQQTSVEFQTQENQADQLISYKRSNKPLAKIAILLGFILFGCIGYFIGIKKANNIEVETQLPTQIIKPESIITPLMDESTKLLDPNLILTTDWKVAMFSQNIITNQGGETKLANIEFKIPTDWSAEIAQVREEKGIGNSICNDLNITNKDKSLLLIIKPDCGNSKNEHISISGQVHKIELITNKGNDGHNSHVVRYFDLINSIYHYGSIGVAPGASIDILKDKIYPNLILQYEPDRYEQWLWTSYDLIYSGTTDNEQKSLIIADTIISTLKLTKFD